MPFGVTNGVSAFQRSIDKFIEDENLKDVFAYVDNVTVCGKTQEEHDRNLESVYKSAEKYNITFNKDKSIISTTSITLLGYTIENNHIKPDYNRLKPLLEMPPPVNLKSQKRIVGMFSYYSRYIQNFSEKIHPLNHNQVFPVPPSVLNSFQVLKNDLKNATLLTIDPEKCFEVETDASDFCVAATLNQEGRPVAFFSRTLNQNEIKHHAAEKEAAAIVEALRTWRHFLLGRHFKVITDQKSVSFMYDSTRKSKIKNDKISRWRIELSQFKFDIIYRPGNQNVVADTFSRINAISPSMQELHQIHQKLCHPGITRLTHFVRTKNLPYSLDQVKQITESCKSCMYLKPKFPNLQGTLIKAIVPFQRLNMDFKGPLPTSTTGNKYLLTIIDEFSRFPFAYPCKDMSSKTIINCLSHLFSIFGMPDMIHTDRGTDFLSEELKLYLNDKGIARSRTSRYNPRCNGQVEKFNGTLWKAIQVSLHSRNLDTSHWESVLPDALHSIRSLLCTATNCTPHERMFSFQRKSTNGKSIPTWMKPGPIYVKNHTRNKYDPPVIEATLVDVNPQYAHVQLPSGTNTTVSLRELAPYQTNIENDLSINKNLLDVDVGDNTEKSIDTTNDMVINANEPQNNSTENIHTNVDNDNFTTSENVRRSSRKTQIPNKYEDFVLG